MDYKTSNGIQNVSYITPQQLNMPSDFQRVIPEPAAEGTFVYDAFISYRHCEPDQYVAEQLHKQLETFRVPASVLKKQKKAGKIVKKKISRVFRDQEELPLATNLEDPIIEALMKSEWLIVICSPRLKESLWCKKEIETFIKYRGREHVLAVLVEGEPWESFPEELLKQEVKVMNPDGSVGFVTRNVEPLAADVRGHGKKEMLNGIKAEMFRILAPMLGLGYDELKQRHRERKVRKVMIAVAVVATISFLFGVLGITSALIISGQKDQIEAQNQEIATQNELLILDQAKSFANESLNLYEKDDRIGAIEMAYKSLTESDGIEMPYTDDGRYALVKSLDPYNITTSSTARYQIKTQGIVEHLTASPMKAVLLMYDSSDTITLWSAVDKKEVGSISLGSDTFSENNVIFKDDDTLVYSDMDEVYEYTISTGETKQITDDDDGQSIYRLRFDASTGILYYMRGATIVGLNQNNQKCFSYTVPSNETPSDRFKYLQGGYLVVASSTAGDSNSLYESNAIVRMLDADGNVVFEKEIPTESYENAYLSGDQFFVLTTKYSHSEKNFASSFSCLRAYNASTGQLQWERTDMNIYADRIAEIKENDGYYLVEIGTHGVVEVDKQTGDPMVIDYEDERILWTGATESAVIYITEKPVEMYVTNYTTIGFGSTIKSNLSDIEMIETAPEGYFMAEGHTNCVVYYAENDLNNFEPYTGSYELKETVNYDEYLNADEIAKMKLEDEIMVRNVAFDYKEDFACVSYKDGTARIVDMDSDEVIATWELESSYETIEEYLGEDDEGNTYWASTDCGYCISVNNQLIASLPYLRYVDKDNNQLIFGSIYDDTRFVTKIFSLEELLEMAEDAFE